ncbi:SRPBCC family protein [Pararcticibacter amylolyticus]|uniref:Orotate phosphoribosyltransferase n=1 Tax=Pararcticibacter amylolyticus TaxID=2173175 RepID=A0A2U2PDX9_9SPHI|nr:SRPBCC family protein [Pararcticibacter amylolyticus]PWG79607.1 orotate phosphoribosyltransferase [Pararcticibacter amylolyticus]
MTVFESKQTINKPIETVYSFLADFNNHSQLMPDNISDWSSSKDEAAFAIKNMARLALKISNRIENQSIIIVPAQEVPFNVEMRWVVSTLGTDSTEAILTISAELNMMMKMMASGPLKKLTDHQTSQLKKILA